MSENKTEIETVKEANQSIEQIRNISQMESANHKTQKGKYFASAMWALAIIAFLVIGSSIWYVVRSTRIQNSTEARVEQHINNLEFDDARDDAARLKSRGAGFWDQIQMRIEQRRETARINRKEEENLRNNGITPGRNQKQFVGMTSHAAKQELIKRGFMADKIKTIEIYNTSRKFKNKEAGTVIGLSINGKQRFKEKDRFRQDSTIEVYVLAKENRDELENMVTVDCRNKDFIGLSLKEATKKLTKLGFDEKKIIKTKVIDNSRKYRDMEEGAVIKILINGDASFKAKDRFPKASSVEIQFLGKP